MKKFLYYGACFMVLFAAMILGSIVLYFITHEPGPVLLGFAVCLEFLASSIIWRKMKPKFFPGTVEENDSYITSKINRNLKHNTPVHIEGYGICLYDGWYDGKFIFSLPDGKKKDGSNLLELSSKEIDRLNIQIQR